MDQSLDLSIKLTTVESGSPADTIASITVYCDLLGLSHTGELLTDPLSDKEREGLNWYLEEYWRWPYEQFAARGKQIEALLPEVGKRLYQPVFGSVGAKRIFQAWNTHKAHLHQISIVTDIPKILSLPWELLHDEHGFLALRKPHPISIVRRLSQQEHRISPIRFESPLRILLITSRPVGTDFVDPRGIAHELLDELQGPVEAGSIEIEFLRPPTFLELRNRLANTQRPIHILHFDGHGTFSEKEKQGMLAFEDAGQRLNLISASQMRRALQGSGVRLVVLTACKSGVSAADDALSSIAAQLLQDDGSMGAIMAMSASVLTVSAARYTEAFYRALVEGITVQAAQERARQALQSDPYRHPYRRHRDEEGEPVELNDWWMPHFYQQYPLPLQPINPILVLSKQQHQTASMRLAEGMPSEPRYGFSGRASELLQIERSLLHGNPVVISGFGGIGKTALVREAADWLTRTTMYDGAYFISFEHGGDAATLLSALGNYLDIYDGHYKPNDSNAALSQLSRKLEEKRILTIVDNLESILSGGEAPLEATELTNLWDVVFELVQMGVGMLLTSQDTDFGDERLAPENGVTHMQLHGLHPEDAYSLATRLLYDLGINRALTPYVELRDLLMELDHHPLAIQLVLPALLEMPLSSIRKNFTAYLPKFVDNAATERNRSLLASLGYSLRRLSEEHRTLLLRLAPFEGGANEDDLLAITEISEPVWILLRSELERAALLTVEPVHYSSTARFLHFHPILAPFLRVQAPALDISLRHRFAQRYHELALNLYFEDESSPEWVRAVVQRELPNFRRAIAMLLEANDLQAVTEMVVSIESFLEHFGFLRERDQLRHLESIALTNAQASGELTQVEWSYELGLASTDLNRDTHASYTRLMALLRRMEELPAGIILGPGSYQHCVTLGELARCLHKRGLNIAAETKIHEALALIERRIDQGYDRQFIDLRGVLYSDLGYALRDQGRYTEAREAYEESSRIAEGQGDKRAQAAQIIHLGQLAVVQWDYPEAKSRFVEAFELFNTLDEKPGIAIAWFELGVVTAQYPPYQEEWAESERYFRESLAINEQIGDDDRAAGCYNWLGQIAFHTGRPGEAEGWWKRAVGIIERINPGSPEHASCLVNLVVLIVDEVRAGHAQNRSERLDEARSYAEQALSIGETLEDPEDSWRTFQMLAEIADLEGRTTIARDYRRQARETFAALKGIRYHLDRLFDVITDDIVAAINGDPLAWVSVKAELRDLEEASIHVTGAVQRIWAGERNWHLLVEGMRPNAALLVLYFLEKIKQPDGAQPKEIANFTAMQVIEALPTPVREAFEHMDIEATNQALENLSSSDEKRRAIKAINYLLSEEAEISYRSPITAFVQKIEPVLREIAAVAIGESTQRAILEPALIELESTKGSKLRERVRSIWDGERNESILIAGLNRVDIAMIRRVLEIIAQTTVLQKKTKAELIASLPESLREALERHDSAAFEQAQEALPFKEQQRVKMALNYLMVKLEEGKQEPSARDIEALVQQAEPWLDDIAAVALGNTTRREKAEEFLIKLEASGSKFRERVQRIWEGERNEAVLLVGVGALDRELTRRLLEVIAQMMGIAQQAEPGLQAMAAVALGAFTLQGQVESVLAELEARGYKIRDRMQRIWKGERDEAVLLAELGALDTVMIRGVLDFIALTIKVVRSFNSFLHRIALVATGDEVHRSEVEAELTEHGEKGLQLTKAVRDIWEGERNEGTLTAQLSIPEVVMVRRVLEIIAQITKMQKMTENQLIMSLPEAVRKAFIPGDLVAFEQAFVTLTFEEQERVGMVMHHLKILREREAVQRFEPLLQKIAAVALGDDTNRSEVEAELSSLETEEWPLEEAVRHIWAGERDEATLTAQLNEEDFQATAVIRRVLGIIAGET